MARTRSVRTSKPSGVKTAAAGGSLPSVRAPLSQTDRKRRRRDSADTQGSNDDSNAVHLGDESLDVVYQLDEPEYPSGCPAPSTSRRGLAPRRKRSASCEKDHSLTLRAPDPLPESCGVLEGEIKSENVTNDDPESVDMGNGQPVVYGLMAPSTAHQVTTAGPEQSTSAIVNADGARSIEPSTSKKTTCHPRNVANPSRVQTKEFGVQVEECPGLYPVGVFGEGLNQFNEARVKPEAALLYEDMKQRLECPVCCKISLPPVMQCRNGHVTCNNCRLKVRSCPMCREVDIDVRNLFAEKAVSFMTIPCEFGIYGCKVETPYREKDLHLRSCKHRPYNCPYIECEHKLVESDVVAHVSTVHRDDCRNSEGPEITASMILIGNFFGGDGAWSPRVITCFDRTFFDVALTRDRWLHHWVWLLGEEADAQSFVYEITAFKGNVKYLYAGEVASLRTPDEEIVSSGQCLSISDPIGKRLRDGDKIRYKLRLSKKEPLR